MTDTEKNLAAFEREKIKDYPAPAVTERQAMGVYSIGTGMVVQPENMAQAVEFAKLMSQSKTAIRKAFRENVGMCLSITMQAMRWGMDPFMVANKSYVVNDQVAFEAQLVHSIVITRAPLQGRLRATYSGEGDSRSCTITGRLIGEEEPFVYTSPALKAITPKNSPLWKSDPDQQLFYRSVASWSRRFTPEVLLGVYSTDEVGAASRLGAPLEVESVAITSDMIVAQAETEVIQGAPTPHDEAEDDVVILEGDEAVDHVAKIIIDEHETSMDEIREEEPEAEPMYEWIPINGMSFGTNDAADWKRVFLETMDSPEMPLAEKKALFRKNLPTAAQVLTREEVMAVQKRNKL